MSRVTEALVDGRVRVLLLFGTDMLSSFADAGSVAKGLARTDLVVSYDLFLNDTARRFADVVLPSTSWLEELGCKSTNTHLYLMDQALQPPGETRPLVVDRCGSSPRDSGVSAERLPLAERRRAARRDPRPSGDGPCDGGGAARRGRDPPAPRSRTWPTRTSLPHAVRQDRALLRARRALGLPRLPVYEALPGVRLSAARFSRDAR